MIAVSQTVFAFVSSFFELFFSTYRLPHTKRHIQYNTVTFIYPQCNPKLTKPFTFSTLILKNQVYDFQQHNKYSIAIGPRSF